MRHVLSRLVFASVMAMGLSVYGATGSPTFSGLQQTFSGEYNWLQSSSIATMTPYGAVPGSVHPLNGAFSDITYDPNGSGYYACVGQDAYHIDPVTYQATVMNVTWPDPQNYGWTIGMTFDSTRNRVILATLSGPGYLISYNPATQQWSGISSLNQVDLQSVAYRPTNDTIYGLPNNGSYSVSLNLLYKYGPSGNLLGTLPLSSPIPAANGIGDFNYQMMLTSDDRLAVLTPPLYDSLHPSASLPPRLYLINPNTGAIEYNAVFPAVPEPSALGLVSLAGLVIWRARPERRRLRRSYSGR